MDQAPDHSPELFRWMAEATTDGLAVLEDGVVVWANPALGDQAGRTRELVGRPVADLFATPPGAEPPTGPHENLEALLRRADGSTVVVLVSTVPLDGTRWLLRTTPYAERRAVLERLQARERQLADAQEIAHLGSWTWVPETDEADWSEEMFRIAGRSPEEWTPTLQSLLDIIHPDDRGTVEQALLSVVAGAESLDFTARVVRPDGTLRWVRGLGRGQCDDDGSTVCLSGTAQDVTALRLADEEAHEAQRRLRLMQGLASAANRAGSLAEVVEVAARVQLEEVSAWQPVAVHVLDDRAAGGAGALTPLTTYDAPVPADDALLAAARSSRDVEVAAPAGDAGGTHRLVAVPVLARDEVVAVITLLAHEVPVQERSLDLLRQAALHLGVVAERERTAAELAEARDEALQASRLKSEFLATMSHEIRTPMNGVVGLTDLLRRTDLDEQQQRLVAGLQDAGLTLLGIINDILDLSKIEAGKLELETADFDVRAVLDQTAAVLAGPAAAKGLELVVACSPDVPAQLRGDPVRFGQVVANLASNAVKFTDRGEVVVRAALAASTPTEVVLRVEVADTGVGIAPDGRAALFDAFTQADPSTTRRHGGTGLGLAISQQLVEALGGEIGVTSELGRGSTFAFTARFARASETPSLVPRHGTALAGRRVLVVDDNATQRTALVEQLDAWQLRPVPVASAAEALATLREAARNGNAFDVVLLDLLDPGVAGLAPARRVRADPDVPQPRLVLLSPDQSVGADAAREAGVDVVVAKPVRSRELHDALAAVLDDGVAAEAPAERAERPGEGDGVRVLVVEDNPVNQLVARGVLEGSGYAVDVASDGAEAVALLSGDHGYAAVLMDCRMPRLDGFDATRAVRRAEPPGRRVPVIAMTASALEGERERCLEAGMDDFLTKPVEPGELDRVLRRWVALPSAATAPAAPPQEVEERAAEDGGPVLDDARVRVLDELRKDGVSFFVRTATSFTSRVRDQVAAIRAAVDAGDAHRAFAASHLVKGSALNLGLPRVAAVAQRLEDHTERGSTVGADGLLADLDREVDRAVTTLRDAVAQRS